MASLSRSKPSWGLLVAIGLFAVPVWKGIEPFWRAAPRSVSLEDARLGRDLFTHRFTERDPLTGGDGLGPVYNGTSCVECHNQGGVGGGGSLDSNVTVFGLAKPHPGGLPRSGVVHRHATAAGLQETLRQVHSSLPAVPVLPVKAVVRSTEVSITERNTPPLFGDGLIDAVTDDDIVTAQRQSAAARAFRLEGGGSSEIKGRVGRLADGRVGRFGWKLEFASLTDFVKAACANELGLSNPGRSQATPLGRPGFKDQGIDLTDDQCGLLANFIRGLPAPVALAPRDPQFAALAGAGRSRFESIGCALCHAESVGPARGIYSDLLLHDLGSGLEGKAGYASGPSDGPNGDQRSDDPGGASPTEWRTAPLWGVADSGPYLHDGRAPDLERAIELHGGEARGVSERFKALSPQVRQSVIVFLKTLHAPPADGGTAGDARVATRSTSHESTPSPL
jgi:CxxC motif-containing protein (DUF1111 family)